MLTIVDCHNFWSAKGGGVRRYTLSKIREMSLREDVRYIFIMPDSRNETEKRAANVWIEHVKAVAPPGTDGGYRLLMNRRRLLEIFRRYSPDVIEIGSWYWLPQLVLSIVDELDKEPALVGFWHADFPRAYVGRHLSGIHPALSVAGEKLGWWWARRGYGCLDAIFVASRSVAQNLERHGLERLCYTPLGIDLDCFHPDKRDPGLVQSVRAECPERPVIFFAHRFQQEKGLYTLLEAYPKLAESRAARGLAVPALVFAGAGPGLAKVEAAANRYPHVHYLGYLRGAEEMSRWLASVDLFTALSPFETFGLSLAEAMASGVAVVSADEGAAAELVGEAGCGATVPYGDVDALVRGLSGTLDRLATSDLGALGRARVEGMTWSNTFSTEIELYGQLVELKRQGGQLPAGTHSLESVKTMPCAQARN